jgi:tRNA(Ile)-lysidine synthase
MLLSSVRKTIDRYHLLAPGDRVVVGVSGGIDSMVLLHQLHVYRTIHPIELIVAHVNHGLRPGEAERERELVEKETNRLGLPFEYGLFDVKVFAKQEGLSLQDGARRVRFRFLNEVRDRYRAQKIALGHNADDQVETVLLRLIRGSGLRGLRGMVPVRDGIVIRPLLETWRREIEAFASEEGVPFLVDSSNLREDYLRNRIRLRLIPLIEKEYQPRFKEIVFRTSAILRQEDELLEQEAEKAYGRMVRKEKEGLSFRFSEFKGLLPALRRRVLRKMAERVQGRTFGEEGYLPGLDEILEKLASGASSFRFSLREGLFVEKRYDEVLMREGSFEEPSSFEAELTFPGRTVVEEIGKEVILEEVSKEDMAKERMDSPTRAWFDLEKASLPLKLRSFKPGDRFQPLGVRGTQKLKEFFIDHKIPRFERMGIPLLVSGERILWVVGYRIDEAFKVTERTKRVLRAELKDVSSVGSGSV